MICKRLHISGPFGVLHREIPWANEISCKLEKTLFYTFEEVEEQATSAGEEPLLLLIQEIDSLIFHLTGNLFCCILIFLKLEQASLMKCFAGMNKGFAEYPYCFSTNPVPTWKILNQIRPLQKKFQPIYSSFSLVIFIRNKNFD